MANNTQGFQGLREFIIDSSNIDKQLRKAPRLFDCYAFLIHCGHHNRIATLKQQFSDETIVRWLPFIRLAKLSRIRDYRYTDLSVNGALAILCDNDQTKMATLRERPPFSQCHLLQIYRLQSPLTLKFIQRFTYYIPLGGVSSKSFDCCQNSRQIEWIEMDQILYNQLQGLWGPELREFCREISQKSSSGEIPQHIQEYSLEKAYYFLPRKSPRNCEESLLAAANLNEKDIERLYMDYVEHCYPSSYQTFESFSAYMIQKYNFTTSNDHRLYQLFQAFCQNNRDYLTFHELLIGLTLIEPSTLHDEYRCQFIYRYYSHDQSWMTIDELRSMIIDINSMNDCPQSIIEQKLLESLRQLKLTTINNDQQVIGRNDFIQAIGSHRIRGTSKLCRSTKSLFEQLTRSMAVKAIRKSNIDFHYESIVNADDQVSICDQCRLCKPQYQLATHSVHLDRQNGQVLAIDRAESMQKSNEINSNTEITATEYSIEFQFNHQSSVAILLIRLIHEFHPYKGSNRHPKGLLQGNTELLLKLLKILCFNVGKLLNVEDRCVTVQSPCYVIGDIHGNLDDLLLMEQLLWPRLLSQSLGASYLFLGDYVDRGQWSLECCVYLLSFKLLCPNQVTLLRGNHEVRTLQLFYTYRKELTHKYGHRIGDQIWQLTNKIFDKLPVTAIIDGRIFCCHGGIPKSSLSIDDIQKIPTKLYDPEHQSSIAWEILWSDPCPNRQFIEMCNFFDIDPRDTDGYLTNIKRGTAYQFNEFGLDNFLHQNQLLMIIRAHEVPSSGYQIHFNGKCLTIFSSSHYCNNQNYCSVILIDQHVLRIITLDTYNKY